MSEEQKQDSAVLEAGQEPEGSEYDIIEPSELDLDGDSEGVADEASRDGQEQGATDTENVPAGPALDDTLRARAKSLGWTDDELAEVKDPAALEQELTRLDRRFMEIGRTRLQGQAQQPAQQGQAAPAQQPTGQQPGNGQQQQPTQFKLSNPDVFDEETRGELENVGKYVDQRVAALEQSLAQRDQVLTMLVQHLSERAEQEAEAQFKGYLAGMGEEYAALLKEGRREKEVLDAARAMAVGFRVQGIEPPPLKELAARAAHAVLGSEIRKLSGQKVAASLKRARDGTFLKRSSSREALPMDPDARAMKRIAEVQREHGLRGDEEDGEL